MWNYVDSKDTALQNSLFGAVNLVKNVNIDKCKYSGYGIGFDVKRTFSFPTGGSGKNVIIFEVDMSSFVHVDKKRRFVLIFGEGLTKELDDTTLTAEKTYSINFTVNRKKFSLSLHYNGGNGYLF